MALMEAAYEGKMDTVSKILKETNGATVNEIGKAGNLELTPLCAAITAKYYNIAEALLAAGAAVNTKCIEDKELAPLHIACLIKDFNFIRLIAERPGADVNIRNKDGETPLHCLLNDKDDVVEMVAYLISKGALVDAQTISAGDTPLHLAAWQNLGETTKLLIESGANVNLKNWNKQSPLALTLVQGFYKMSRVLVHKYNARVTEDCVNITLHKSDLVMMVYLLEHLNPEIETKQQVMDRLLFITCKNRYPLSVLEWLVCHGADPKAPIPDFQNRCALFVAIKHGNRDHVSLLIKWGWLLTKELEEELKVSVVADEADIEFAKSLTAEVKKSCRKKSYAPHLGALASFERPLTQIEEFLVKKIASKLA